MASEYVSILFNTYDSCFFMTSECLDSVTSWGLVFCHTNAFSVLFPAFEYVAVGCVFIFNYWRPGICFHCYCSRCLLSLSFNLLIKFSRGSRVPFLSLLVSYHLHPSVTDPTRSRFSSGFRGNATGLDNLILVLFFLDFYNFNYKNVSKLVSSGTQLSRRVRKYMPGSIQKFHRVSGGWKFIG